MLVAYNQRVYSAKLCSPMPNPISPISLCYHPSYVFLYPTSIRIRFVLELQISNSAQITVYFLCKTMALLYNED